MSSSASKDISNKARNFSLIDKRLTFMFGSSSQKPLKAPSSLRLDPPSLEDIRQVLGLKEQPRMIWLAGDGSDRCYYRILSDELAESLVLMQLSEADARHLRSDTYDWIAIGHLLTQQGIRVPRLIATMKDAAALIIEDYGNLMMEQKVLQLLQAREPKEAEVLDLYTQAFHIALQIHDIQDHTPQAVWHTRAFDRAKYLWELEFFKKQYCENVLFLQLNAAEQKAWEHDIHQLALSLEPYSRVCVHRDFHSRNLMIKDDDIAVIDFQDARMGALAYDFISLIYDNYVPLSLTLREKLWQIAFNLVASSWGPHEAEVLAEQKNMVLLQRQLKAIGTYGYLTKTKGRGDYLRYVPAALQAISEGRVFDQRWPFISSELISKIGELVD